MEWGCHDHTGSSEGHARGGGANMRSCDAYSRATGGGVMTTWQAMRGMAGGQVGVSSPNTNAAWLATDCRLLLSKLKGNRF